MAVLEAPRSSSVQADVQVVLAATAAVQVPARLGCGMWGDGELERVGGEADGGAVVVGDVISLRVPVLVLTAGASAVAVGEQLAVVMV